MTLIAHLHDSLELFMVFFRLFCAGCLFLPNPVLSNFMENTDYPAYAKLAAVGREITTDLKPKAVVVSFAHWQGGPNKIKINVA